MALRGHILTQPREIGGILTTSEHQQKLATLSREWRCPTCGIDHARLVPGAGAYQIEPHLLGDKSKYKGFSIDIGPDGTVDMDALLSLAESENMKELKLMTKRFHRVKLAKIVRQKKQRLQILRRLVWSIFVGFAVFYFQFWSLTSRNLAEKAFDPKTAAW